MSFHVDLANHTHRVSRFVSCAENLNKEWGKGSGSGEKVRKLRERGGKGREREGEGIKGERERVNNDGEWVEGLQGIRG